MSSTNQNYIVTTDNKTLGYIIAGITLGACLGNMFLAGKIRNVMKIKIPKPETSSHNKSNWKSSSNSTNHHANHSTNNTSNDKYQQYHNNPSEHTTTTTSHIKTIPSYISNYLHILELPMTHDITEKDIKNAYYQLVMKYHPDKIPLNETSLKLKTTYEMKFKDITYAYNELLIYYQKNI